MLGMVCLAGQSIAQGQANSHPPPAGAGPATGDVFIFNDSGPTLISSNQNVTANDKRVTSLPRMTYAKLAFPPGTLVLRPDPFLWKQEVTLTVGKGTTHYVVVAYKPARSWAAPLAGAPLLLREISEAEAAPLFNEMRPQ